MKKTQNLIICWYYHRQHCNEKATARLPRSSSSFAFYVSEMAVAAEKRDVLAERASVDLISTALSG